MDKTAYTTNFLVILVTLLSLQTALTHPVERRSILSWFRDDEPKVEEVVIPGYKPILEVHKYNGVRINPINGAPPVFFESGSPISTQQITAGSDQQIVNLLYSAAPFLPEEDRMHELDLATLSPYIDIIPNDSIDRLRFTLEAEAAARVGLKQKSKLLKLLQIIKEKKLAPFKALYKKKKDAIQSVLGLFNPPPPPPPPHPTPIFPFPHPPPPPPPSHSDSVLIPAAPSVFALPPQIYLTNELPPPSLHILPQPMPNFLSIHNRTPEYSSITQGVFFEHPGSQREIHEDVSEEIYTDKKDPCAPKDEKCGGNNLQRPEKSFTSSSQQGPFYQSVNIDHIPSSSFAVPVPPPTLPIQDELYYHRSPVFAEGNSHFQPALEAHFSPDLHTSGSENEEKYSVLQTSLPVPINDLMQLQISNSTQLSTPTTTSVPHTIIAAPQFLTGTESSSPLSTTSPSS